MRTCNLASVGRRSLGEASAWSMDIVKAVSFIREAVGMSNQELVDGSGMSASYYYARMRGAAPFDTNDIERLAFTLGKHPHEISRLAATIGDADDIEPMTETEPHELARRLMLVAAAPRGDGSPFDASGLIKALAVRGGSLDQGEWEGLVGSTWGRSIRTRVLEGVAEYAGISARYFIDLEDGAAADATEAQIEFRQALKESGAESVSARAVGDISPAALRAIAQSLRSIDSFRPQP